MLCSKLISRVMFKINFIEVHLHTNKTHSVSVHRSMSFDKCIHPCNHHHFQDVEYFYHPQIPLIPLCSQFSPRLRVGKSWCVSCHYTLVSPLLELQRNWITHYVLFCVSSLSFSIVFWRIIVLLHMYISSSFLFVDEQEFHIAWHGCNPICPSFPLSTDVWFLLIFSCRE